MNYLCAALFSALLLLGWLYHSTSEELTTTKQSLAVAIEVNETNRKAAERLERHISNTDNILAGWNEDRTTLSGVRQTVLKAIREGVSDAFKIWLSTRAPDDAFRLLGKALDQDRNDSASPTNSITSRLSGDNTANNRVKQ